MSSNKKINLLTDAEVEDLYSRPQFNMAERGHYFSLGEDENPLLNKYIHLKSKIYFILQLGYFQATKQFYKFTLDEVREDVAYLIKKYFASIEKEIKGTIWKENYRQQKEDILSL